MHDQSRRLHVSRLGAVGDGKTNDGRRDIKIRHNEARLREDQAIAPRLGHVKNAAARDNCISTAEGRSIQHAFVRT